MVIKAIRDVIVVELSITINTDIQKNNMKVREETLNKGTYMKTPRTLDIGKKNCILQKMNNVRFQIIKMR